MHSTGREKHPFSFSTFLLTKTPQVEKFSLTVKRMYLNIPKFFVYDPAYRKRTFAAAAKDRTQRFVHAGRKLYDLEEEMVPLSQAAGFRFRPYTPSDSHRVGKRSSTGRSWFDRGVVSIRLCTKKALKADT